ncbi:multidrug MFS transporter [Pontibacillus chungwhensis BH030062]|uniref:Multidrug MFS transporter n=1 Tax=Pontibacillus chungwhensis BH030062 TaxID=1385513 RepID=A0A0A2UUG5_9BACI|nr:TIGR01777 family oxidoreductase [Pontibacillus chungwhensis]KGP91579.1 multidrug MFS transporter [Pontibacillus chungwhensis BH030062]
MNILISGGTGFIGSHIVNHFEQQGHKLLILTRGSTRKDGQREYIQWLTDQKDEVDYLSERKVDVVINLAGDPIDQGRWSSEKKERILNSRINATKRMIEIVNHLEEKPEVFIQGSAIGYYGYSEEEKFTDRSLSLINSFPSEVCDVWENTLHHLNHSDIRKVIARIGIVLHPREGALAKLLIPYRLWAGGKVASGSQYVSWIHLEDLVSIIDYLIADRTISGPVNVTAPHPVTMDEFGRTIASIISRPYWFPLTEWMLKVAFGEKSIILMKGSKVLPERLLNSSFTFNYPTVRKALSNLLE